MLSGDARNDATLSYGMFGPHGMFGPYAMFGILPGEQRANQMSTTGVASPGSIADDDRPNRDGQSFAFAVDAVSPRPAWERIVNRLLDWADEARQLGRRRRADNLVSLAWKAYERMHP